MHFVAIGADHFVNLDQIQMVERLPDGDVRVNQTIVFSGAAGMELWEHVQASAERTEDEIEAEEAFRAQDGG